jgi:tetratricopeptide (TPR) repeat protein
MRLAALSVGLTLAALCGTPGAAQGEGNLLRSNAADIRHKQGTKLFAAGKYHAALKDFKRAYKIRPRPESLVSIAACHEQLDRPREAINALELYVSKYPKHSGHAKAKEKISELKRRLLLDYGDAGEEEAEQGAILEETPRWPRTLGWVSLSAGAAFLVTGAIFSALASNKAKEYKENKALITYTELQDIEQTGERFQAVQISTLVIGSVLALGGAVLVWTFQEPEQVGGSSTATLAPFINGADGVGLAAVGRF